MTPQEFEQILHRVLQEGVSLSAFAYVGLLLALAAGSIIGAFLGAYAKRKGENYATTEDFTKLREQLKQTTATVEETKAVVVHADRVKQAQWEMKRDAYIKLVDVLNRLRYSTLMVAESYSPSIDADYKARNKHRYDSAKREQTELAEELGRVGALCQLFMPDETLDVIKAFKESLNSIDEIQDSYVYFNRLSEAADRTYVSVVNAGKRDLFPG